MIDNPFTTGLEVDPDLISGSFSASTMEAEETAVDNARYNEEGERLYYWVPPSELGDPKRSSEESELYKDTGGYYTEAEIRAAWDADEGMGYLKEQTDWDNYWGYLTERQDLIDDGVLSDGTSVTQAQLQAKREAIQAAGGLKESGGAKGAGKGTSQVTLAARQDAFNAMINDPAQVELMNKYGLSMSFQNDDGDTFRWNGSSYTKTDKIAGPNWGLLVGAAMTGYILGPQIAGLGGLTGGFSGGAASGAVGSVITQGIATGSVDFGQVATAGVLGGIGGFFDDLQAATPGTYGGWVVNGEVVGTAGTWGIEKGQYLADLLNIPLDEALGIMEGVLTGAVTGEDLEGIAINAVGGWGEAYTNQWIKDTLGNQGLDVDNLFKDGTSNISTESLQGLVSEGFDALLAGGMSETDALKAIYGFFDDGGTLDFLLPMLPELGFEGDLFDIPGFCEIFPKLCDIDIDINLPNPCPDGFWDKGDGYGCVKIPDVNINNPCPDGFIDNGDGKGCVKIPEVNINNPCPDGFIDKGDGKGCVKIPKITCPEGFRNEDGECVKIEVDGPDIDVDTPDLDIDIDLPKPEFTSPDSTGAGYTSEGPVGLDIGLPAMTPMISVPNVDAAGQLNAFIARQFQKKDRSSGGMLT